MCIKREFFGETPEGAPVYLYHLSNENEMEVTVMNYGVNLRNVFVKDKDGVKRDVVLGYADVNGYFGNLPTLGSTIGPCANRTAGAAYTIDGETFHLEVNEKGVNNLHTDLKNGFHKRIWEAEEADNAVVFTLEAADGELGFPGNRTYTIEVSLSEENELKLHYHMESDKNTLVNLTNHTYFNLGGHASGKVYDHVLQLNASHFTPVADDKSIPTGEIRPVAGTPLDFTAPKTIGRDIDADYDQLKYTSGYDHNFCIDGAMTKDGQMDSKLRNFANVTNPATGITMHCFTTLPGFQFYSANFLHEEPGKEDTIYRERDGLCLETQLYPNSINTPGFPNPVYGPERPYDSVTVYQFK